MSDAFELRPGGTAPGKEHLDALEALLFLDGELPPEGAIRAAAHAETCRRCSGLLNRLERESRWLHQTLREADPAPAGAAAPRGWFWPALLAGGGLAAGAAAAIMLAPLAGMVTHVWGAADLLTTVFFDGLFWQRWGAVLGGLQLSVFAALVALVFALLLPRRRRRWHAPAGMALMAVLLLAPPGAAAARTFRGPSYVLPAGQTLHDDLFVTGDAVRIDGTVEGDVVSWARELTINGQVDGNVIAFAQYVNIPGRVGGGLFAFADSVEIAGSIERQFYGFVHHVHIGPSGRLGAATLSCGTLDFEGATVRDLIVHTGAADLAGTVGGKADLHGGRVEIAASTRVGQRLTVYGKSPPRLAPGATLAGGWQYVAHRAVAQWRQSSFYWYQVLLWAAAFLVGWLMLAALPGFARRSLGEVEAGAGSAGRSFGLGVIALVATPVIAILLAITVIGLPLAVILAFAYAIAIYLAEVIVGLWIGRSVLGATPLFAMQAWPALAVGLAIERVALNLPFHLGLLACLAITIFGLGAQGRALYLGWPRLRPAPAPMHPVHA
ncbi:MAG: hypothetical protein ACRD2H_12570 [Terriglobales bacterium]